MSNNPPLVPPAQLASDDELEALLAEGQELNAQDSEASAFADLDSLLTDTLKDQQAKEQYAADLKARKRSFVGMSKEEVDFCNSRMAAFEAARIWEVQYAISVWAVFECQSCERDRMVFSRLMEHQTSRVNRATRRWVTVTETKAEEQYAVKEIRPVPTCPRCTEWDLDPRNMTDIKEVLE